MFCVKCGREIGDAKFCQFCGQPTSAVPMQNGTSQVLEKVSEKLKEFGYGKLISIASVVWAAVGVFIRSRNEVLETVRYGLAFDDYYVISEEGRSKIVTVMMIHIVLTIILFWLGKKSKDRIPMLAILLAVVAIGVMVAAMTVRISAPY